MKNILFFLFFLPIFINAQSVKLYTGINLGANNVWMNKINPLIVKNGTPNDQLSTFNSSKITGGYGAFIGLDFTSHLGIISEINFLRAGQKFQDSIISVGKFQNNISINYMQIPLMLQLRTGSDGTGFYLQGGMAYSLLQSAQNIQSNSTTTETYSIKNKINPNDLSVVGGLGIRFKVNEHFGLQFGFKGSFGTKDINLKDPLSSNIPAKSTNGSIGINMGLSYHF
jgi:opacity protein-like surface antigen